MESTPPEAPDLGDILKRIPKLKPLFTPTYQRVLLRELLAKGKVIIRCKCGENWSLHAGASEKSHPCYGHRTHGKEEDEKEQERLLDGLNGVRHAFEALRQTLPTEEDDEKSPFTLEIEVEVAR